MGSFAELSQVNQLNVEEVALNCLAHQACFQWRSEEFREHRDDVYLHGYRVSWLEGMTLGS